MSSIQQLHHAINDVICFLPYDWSSSQLDESMTNNDQSKDIKRLTSLIGWCNFGIKDTILVHLAKHSQVPGVKSQLIILYLSFFLFRIFGFYQINDFKNN